MQMHFFRACTYLNDWSSNIFLEIPILKCIFLHKMGSMQKLSCIAIFDDLWKINPVRLVLFFPFSLKKLFKHFFSLFVYSRKITQKIFNLVSSQKITPKIFQFHFLSKNFSENISNLVFPHKIAQEWFSFLFSLRKLPKKYFFSRSSSKDRRR